MGPSGPAGAWAVTTPRRSGIEPRLGQMPLQRARAGERPTGEHRPESDPEEAGPPVRMLTPQVQGRGDQHRVGGGLRGPTPAISRHDGLGALDPQASDQMADGVGLEPQILGDLSRVLTVLAPLQDQLSQGDGDGSGHGRRLLLEGQGISWDRPGDHPTTINDPRTRENSVSGFLGKT
jgi:hypothetical protein